MLVLRQPAHHAHNEKKESGGVSPTPRRSPLKRSVGSAIDGGVWG
jgi:hypothetical protein